MRHLISYLKGFYMSLGMFCGIPLPFHIWDEKKTSYMLLSFPFVGLVIGAIWWLTALLLAVADIPVMLSAAVLSIIPFSLTGFIHLDGYMDTSDAVLSRRSLEDKLRILIDSRVGAFAVIMLCIAFLLQFSSMYTVVEIGKHYALFIIICILSRCCAAFSFFYMRHNQQSNFLPLFKQRIGMSYGIFIVIIAIIVIFASYIYAGFLGLTVCAALILGYFPAIWRASKSLGGISGDLLGYALVISELCALMGLAVFSGRL